MKTIAWVGLDVPDRTCPLARRVQKVRRQQHWQFPTAEPQLVEHPQIDATQFISVWNNAA